MQMNLNFAKKLLFREQLPEIYESSRSQLPSATGNTQTETYMAQVAQQTSRLVQSKMKQKLRQSQTLGLFLTGTSWILSANHSNLVASAQSIQGSHIHRESTEFLTTHDSINLHSGSILERNDYYTAAWWQSIERFQEFDAEDIRDLEAATFHAVEKAGSGSDDAIMTKDWLDFCTEHLSKYFKYVKGGHEHLIQRLTDYMAEKASFKATTIMNTTLAIIPFMNGPGHHVQSPRSQVTTAALGATLTSLIGQGVQRIVVTGISEKDHILYESCLLQLLLPRNGGDGSDQEMNFGKNASSIMTVMHNQTQTIHQTQIVYVTLPEEDAITINKINQGPKATLCALQEVLMQNPDSPERARWLGSQGGSLQHIYFSEPDQILSTRVDRSILDILSDGKILLPHRFAPYPHESDFLQSERSQVSFRGPLYAGSLSHYATILEDCQHCLDAGRHLLTQDNVCHGGLWWMCALDHEDEVLGSDGQSGYALFRMGSGSNLVLVAGNNHARQCVPQHCKTTTYRPRVGNATELY